MVFILKQGWARQERRQGEGGRGWVWVCAHPELDFKVGVTVPGKTLVTQVAKGEEDHKERGPPRGYNFPSLEGGLLEPHLDARKTCR